MPDQSIQLKPTPACNECNRRQAYYKRRERPSSGFDVMLNAAGLCVDCAPVAHTCDRGAACEYDRIMDWKANYGGSRAFIAELRLCSHHDAIRAERLGRAAAS